MSVESVRPGHLPAARSSGSPPHTGPDRTLRELSVVVVACSMVALVGLYADLAAEADYLAVVIAVCSLASASVGVALTRVALPARRRLCTAGLGLAAALVGTGLFDYLRIRPGEQLTVSLVSHLQFFLLSQATAGLVVAAACAAVLVADRSITTLSRSGARNSSS